MDLTKIMRQSKEQKQLLNLLQHCRHGYPREEDKYILLSLHLNSGNFTELQIEEKKGNICICKQKRYDRI
jgi:hypothetical protein